MKSGDIGWTTYGFDYWQCYKQDDEESNVSEPVLFLAGITDIIFIETVRMQVIDNKYELVVSRNPGPNTPTFANY